STPSTLDADDMVYIVAGPDRYIALRRSGEDCDSFRATDGAAGVFYEITGEETCGAGTTPELWRYVDQTGTFFDFFGFDAEADRAKGRLWRVTDPAGNMAYFGDGDDPCVARNIGFDGDGLPVKMFDPAGRRYIFT